MAKVHVCPLPEWAEKVSPHLWPMHPPLFDEADGPITDADRALAAELIDALDPLSQRWYRGRAGA